MYVGIFLCVAMTFVKVNANPDKQLHIKVAVVTGGAKGIGYAIVDNYLKNGAETVIIVDKNEPRGIKAETDLNCKYGANRTVFIHGDITKDLDRVATIILNTFGYVDVLVNNAGILNEEDPELTIKTNALGTILWTRRFYECMRKDRGGRGGTIINIASITGYYSDPFLYFYKASKFAVIGITVGMGHEYNYRNSGTKIIAICPGYTRTDLTLKQQMALDEHEADYKVFSQAAPWQDADDVGKAAVILFNTGVTGTIYTVEGGRAPVVSPDRVNITMEFLKSIL